MFEFSLKKNGERNFEALLGAESFEVFSAELKQGAKKTCQDRNARPGPGGAKRCPESGLARL